MASRDINRFHSLYFSLFTSLSVAICPCTCGASAGWFLTFLIPIWDPAFFGLLVLLLLVHLFSGS